MLNKQKLLIYSKYEGNADAFSRLATIAERSILNYEDWILIENLVQDLYFIQKGLASTAFEKKTYQMLKLECDSRETIQLVTELIK